MKKNCFLFLCFLFIFGCSHTKAYNYAEYNESIKDRVSIYTQYEMVIQKQDGNLIVRPFLANSNSYLPKRVIKLHLGAMVVNPYEKELNIWVNQKIIDIDTNQIFENNELYKTRNLPREFISIGLPYQISIHSQVENMIEIQLKDGSTLFKSKSMYKVGR